MTRILFIAHHFPPLGGAGVQRSLKFAKYLPDNGIVPVVLTGGAGHENWWAPPDETLSAEIPDCVRVYRTDSGSASSRVLGARHHFAEMVSLGEKAGVDNGVSAVFVSMSPFSDAAVARELSRRLGVPWIADLRDPWALDEFQVYPTGFHRLAELRRMERALRSASVIIMNTPAAARRLRVVLPGLSGSRVEVITNGYDAADFALPICNPVRDSFKIVHTGFLHTAEGLHQRRHRWQYRLLGRAGDIEILTRSNFYLVRALERWQKTNGCVRDQVSVTFVGSMSSADTDQIRCSSISHLTRCVGYLPHAETIQFMRGADLLFLPLHRIGSNRPATIVPGKTYEYLAAGVPILAALPNGDAREFVRSAGTGLVCEPDDVSSMVANLDRQFNEWADGRSTVTWNKQYVMRFERRELAARLAAILRSVFREANESLSLR